MIDPLLTIVAVYFELKLVKACRPLGWAIQKWALVGLVFSMWLSIQLGMFFHAASSAMMAAGMASTMAANMVYGFKLKMQNAAFRAKINHRKTQYHHAVQTKNEFKATYGPMARKTGRIIALPFKVAKIPVNRNAGRPIWS